MCSPWEQFTIAPDHSGAMCCICLEWFPVSELAVDQSDGRPIDVCVPCAPAAGITLAGETMGG